MAHKIINYEEDIFFLVLQVKYLRDGIKLDIDPEYFLQKINQDISFIKSTIDQVYYSITKKTLLLNRSDYLKSLQRLINSFNKFLDDIINNRTPFSAHLTGTFNQLINIQNDCDSNLTEISNLLSSDYKADYDQEHIVSKEEFEFLLSNEEESL